MGMIFIEGVLMDEAEQQQLAKLREQYTRFIFLSEDDIEQLFEIAAYDDIIHDRRPRWPRHQTYMDYYMIYATEHYNIQQGESRGKSKE